MSREIIFEVFQPMWSAYLNVTNRQTGERTYDILWHHCAMRIASGGKNQTFAHIFANYYWSILSIFIDKLCS